MKNLCLSLHARANSVSNQVRLLFGFPCMLTTSLNSMLKTFSLDSTVTKKDSNDTSHDIVLSSVKTKIFSCSSVPVFSTKYGDRLWNFKSRFSLHCVYCEIIFHSNQWFSIRFLHTLLSPVGKCFGIIFCGICDWMDLFYSVLFSFEAPPP